MMYSSAVVLSMTLLAACAPPSPTATPTQPQGAAATPTKAAPTPTKAPTATPTKRPLVKATVAFPSVSLSYVSVWIPRGKGFFQEEGLDVDWVLIGSGTKVAAAVTGRSVDAGLTGATDIIPAIAQGQQAQTFAVVSIRQALHIVMRSEVAERKGVTRKSSLEDRVRALKGLKIAASSPGTSTDFIVRYVLTKYNIDPERDVEMAYVTSQGMFPALEQGVVGAASLAEPEASKAVTDGFGMVLISYLWGDVPETNDTLYQLAFSHRDTMQSKPEVLEAFVRAQWRGIRLVKENRDDARESVFREVFPEMDPALFRTAFDAVYESVPASPAVSDAAFRSTLDYRNKTTTEQPWQTKFEDFYTNSFVEAAKRQLGF
ncbi:MAG: ABC transporter substrate-binding protein [Chloroflexi bacterium]|nr:ABC transporter substrate-binding protein [Chloroflexota bacterium]